MFYVFFYFKLLNRNIYNEGNFPSMINKVFLILIIKANGANLLHGKCFIYKNSFFVEIFWSAMLY